MTPLAQDLFAQARDFPESERDVFLAEACGGDAELRLEVQRMLVDAARADSFFADGDGATMGAEEFKETYSEKGGRCHRTLQAARADRRGRFRLRLGSHEWCPMVTPDGKFLFFSRWFGESWETATDGEVYWVDIRILEPFRPKSAGGGSM